MSFEEIQIDPLKLHGLNYLRLVERRIEEGRYWVIVEEGRIRFQLTINALLEDVGQITGVYTPPEFRGLGYAKRGLQDFTRVALGATQMLSLLVNDFNAPAIKVYESLGFKPSSVFRVIYLDA
jgi:predicted GNAT family acetyltransferase